MESETTAGSASGTVLPTTRRGWALVALVLFAALVLRLAAIAVTPGYSPKTDALHFDLTASSLVEGDGFGHALIPPNYEEQQEPTAFRAPGYAVALAAVYKVAGPHSYTAGRLLNVGLGVGVVALTGVLAAMVLNRRIGFAAMLVATVYPPLILVGSSLQLEPMMMCLVLGSLLCALAYRRAPATKWLVGAGVLAGVGVLTRETAALVLPSVLWLVWAAERQRHPDRKPYLKTAAVLGLAVLTVLPWTIRNFVVLDEFVPVSNSTGVGLAGTYNETAMNDPEYPAGWREPWEDPFMLQTVEELDDPTEYEASQAYTKASLEVIRDHPEYVVKAAFWSGVRLFALDGGAADRRMAGAFPFHRGLLAVSILASYLMYVLVAVGAWRHRAQLRSVPKPVWLVALVAIPFFMLFLPGHIRYRYWLVPFSVLAIAPFVSHVIDRVLERLPGGGKLQNAGP